MTVRRVLPILDEFETDAVIVTSASNRRYLTGFTAGDVAPDRSSGIVLATAEGLALYTSPTNQPWARAEVRNGIAVGTIADEWPQAMTAMRDGPRKRIGFEDLTTTYHLYSALRELVGPDVELVPVGGAIDALRAVKEDEEIGALRRALDLTDAAFAAAAARLDAGMTEHGFASIVEDELRSADADGLAFPVIVAAGENAARPHHAPGDHVIVEGEPVIVDMGALVDGYHGDLTRTLWLGQPDSRLVTIYRLVAEAQEAAFAAIRPGTSCAAVDAEARAVFAREGVAANFVHGLGHGVGLRIHEAPWFNATSSDDLVPGNVVTVEPGLYFAEWGGVRIEDVVLITDVGFENLTTSAKRVV